MTVTTETLSSGPIQNVLPAVVYIPLFVLLLSWVYWRLVNRRRIRLADKLPGPNPCYPLVGHAPLVFGMSSNEMFKFAFDLSKKFKDKVVKVWFGPRLIVGLYDPTDVELILSSSVHIDKSPEYSFFKPWFGNGLLISTGQKWKAHRKLIAPTFHLNVLKSFIDLFNKNSREVVEKLDKEGGKVFDVHDHMSEATVEILLETVMGVNKKNVVKSGYEYAMAVMKMCDILHYRHTKLHLRPDLLFNFTKYGPYQEKLLSIIKGLTERVVKTKRHIFEDGFRGSDAPVPEELKSKISGKNLKSSTPENSGISFGQSVGLTDDLDVEDDIGEKKRMAFLDSLLDSAAQKQGIVSDEEVVDQVNTIMFEGHDTTAAASSFFLCMMGTHPKIQQKVQQEIYEIFGDSDRPATFADTLEMKYLERCMMETLRLYPPVPIIARHILQDVKLPGKDMIIPADTTVVIGIYAVHQDESVYPNPSVFNPDNFLPERMAARHHYSFVPFSAGPRSCVGRKYAMLKLKILLSTIIRNFNIKSTIPQDEFELQGDIILKRADGFKIMLEKRKLTSTN